MSQNPDQNSNPQGHFDFLGEIKKTSRRKPEKWSRAALLVKFGIEPWEESDVKRRDKFFKIVTTVRRKALYQNHQILLFADGLYWPAGNDGKDSALVMKALRRYSAAGARSDKRYADTLKVGEEEGLLTKEAVRILKAELAAKRRRKE